MGWGELFELKRIFGVSVQTLTFRCNELGIFSKSLYRNLSNEFNRRGWRGYPYEEPFSTKNGEEPTRFSRLCYRALAEELIFESKAAELPGLSDRDLALRMNEPLEPEESLIEVSSI